MTGGETATHVPPALPLEEATDSAPAQTLTCHKTVSRRPVSPPPPGSPACSPRCSADSLGALFCRTVLPNLLLLRFIKAVFKAAAASMPKRARDTHKHRSSRSEPLSGAHLSLFPVFLCVFFTVPGVGRRALFRSLVKTTPEVCVRCLRGGG